MKTTKQILMTVAVLLLSATASAYDFEVDGFYYNILSASDFTVEVTSGDNKYSGDIVIPETMVYKSRVLKVTSIGNYAFRDCSSLTSINIPESVTSIGYGAFYKCSSLTSITLPEGVTSIGDNAFAYCSSLTSITLPEGVTSIGEYAFYKCSSLTSITLPEGVTSIGDNAFDYCGSLERVTTINCAYVGSWFRGLSSLKEIVLGESVTSIGDEAFYGCTSLTSITIPTNVTSIGEYAFYECSSLTSIAIPGSVTRIDDEAFSGCTSLKDLVIEDGDGTLSLGYNCYEKHTMGQGLFYDCPLEFLYLGRDLAYDSSFECGYSPFSNKETLTTITIGNSVTSIGKPFYGCNAIERVELNSPSIGDWFSGKISLKEVVIGNSVTSIGDEAFFDCSGLVTIHLLGKTPPSNRGDNFTEGQFVNTTLYVPQGSLAAYQSADVWKNFWDIREKDVTETPDVEVKKCAAPTISYNDNGLDIATDTEGAEILCTITCSDVNSYNSSRIDFSATYSITAYATKPGCEDSESVTATLCWIAVSGNSGEDGIIEVKAIPVLITCMDGTISIRGGQEGTEVLVYSVNGVSIGNATITNGNATINTTLAKGEIAVVSIAGRSFKVVIQ